MRWIKEGYLSCYNRSSCEVDKKGIIRSGYNWEFVKGGGKGLFSLGCKRVRRKEENI